jgi:hypothetical protein
MRSGLGQVSSCIGGHSPRLNPLRFMNLDDVQRKTVSGWITDGLKLSEIQNRLASELGLRLTYMEVRLLVDDLKLTPKDPEPPKPVPTLSAPAAAGKDPKPVSTPPATGGVTVNVDQVTRPGALVSGKVTFSDGQKADWYLDQMGRLGVVPQQQGYKPSQPDVQQFQLTLEQEMAKLGF